VNASSVVNVSFSKEESIHRINRFWIAEIVFSSIKRVLGEDLLSKKFKAQKVEAGLKVMLLQ